MSPHGQNWQTVLSRSSLVYKNFFLKNTFSHTHTHTQETKSEDCACTVTDWTRMVLPRLSVPASVIWSKENKSVLCFTAPSIYTPHRHCDLAHTHYVLQKQHQQRLNTTSVINSETLCNDSSWKCRSLEVWWIEVDFCSLRGWWEFKHNHKLFTHSSLSLSLGIKNTSWLMKAGPWQRYAAVIKDRGFLLFY